MGNHRLYPAADRLQLRLRCAPPTLLAAAHRGRSCDTRSRVSLLGTATEAVLEPGVVPPVPAPGGVAGNGGVSSTRDNDKPVSSTRSHWRAMVGKEKVTAALV